MKRNLLSPFGEDSIACGRSCDLNPPEVSTFLKDRTLGMIFGTKLGQSTLKFDKVGILSCPIIHSSIYQLNETK